MTANVNTVESLVDILQKHKDIVELAKSFEEAPHDKKLKDSKDKSSFLESILNFSTQLKNEHRKDSKKEADYFDEQE